MKSVAFAALLVACIGGGCRSLPYLAGIQKVPIALAAPPVAQLSSADMNSNQLFEVGRHVYTNQCTRCHGVMPIADYSHDKWMNSIIPRMAMKANLTSDETHAIVAYVDAARRSISMP